MKILIPALVSMACVFSSAESMSAADLILHGGKVYTTEPGQGLQQAVAIENGKVLAVGSDEQVLRLKAAGTRVVDLQGKVERLFSGWMFADSPALNAIDHPVYDVWLVDCKQSSDTPPPDRTNPPSSEVPPEPSQEPSAAAQ